MVRVPQYISRQPMLLWFEIDELIVFIMPLLLWMLFNFSFALCLILCVVCMVVYKNAKRTSSRGFLYHIFYMLGGKFQGFESVHERRYRE
ncbi:MAG: type IV conjugative transfer system protein TraL [Deferribacteraceae bacterium]|jgi:type IV conjugative transfer system protein TraL|nr:type IV conjugative transfer system protein TraL [Deferribacteraceae bacterium]